MNLEDINKQLDSTLNDIHDELFEIAKSGNILLRLLNSRVLERWHSLNVLYKEYIEQRNTSDINCIMEGKNFSARYRINKRKVEGIIYTCEKDLRLSAPELMYDGVDTYYDCLVIYEPSWESLHSFYNNQDDIEGVYKLPPFTKIYSRDWDEEECDIIICQKMSCEGFGDNFAKDLSSLESSFHLWVGIWSVFSVYIENLLNAKGVYLDQCISALKLGYEEYTLENKARVSRKLEAKAHKMKNNRSERLSPELWGKVMAEEDVILGFPENENAECEQGNYVMTLHEDLQENFILKLKDNSAMIKSIQDSQLDGHLFDFGVAVNDYLLLDTLNTDNLQLLYELILRRDTIQREMFPELKKERKSPADDKHKYKNISFRAYLVDESKSESVIPLLHNHFDGMSGKPLALRVECAVEAGLITKPTFTALKKEFKISGTSQAFSQYFQKDKFTPIEKEKIIEMMSGI